jgi:membrane protease YdiL (CAAX protease family)
MSQPGEKHPQFPNAPQAGLMLVSLFLGEVFFYALLRELNGLLGLSPEALGVLATLLANGLLLTGVMQLKGLSHRALLHPSAASPGAVFGLLLVPVLLITPVLVLAVGWVNQWLQWWLPLSDWEALAFERMAEPSIVMLTAVCVLAPVLEEMLFRGVILRAFLQLYPRGLAIGGSALIFGFAHMNIYQFVVGVGIGAVSGWLYERTRSLLPCITLHAAFNGLVTLLALLDTESLDTAPALAGTGAALAAGLLGAWWLRRLLGGRAEA